MKKIETLAQQLKLQFSELFRDELKLNNQPTGNSNWAVADYDQLCRTIPELAPEQVEAATNYLVSQSRLNAHSEFVAAYRKLVKEVLTEAANHLKTKEESSSSAVSDHVYEM